MSDPIFSPDGKFMWSGSEWIPAHPNSSSQSADVSLQDSVVGGDVNITQNNPDDIAQAMVSALEKLGFVNQSSPSELTHEQAEEVEKMLVVAEQIKNQGTKIEPWTELQLGNAAALVNKSNISQSHFSCALDAFRKNGNKEGEAQTLNGLGFIARINGDLIEAERMQRESLVIHKEIGNNNGEELMLTNLGMLVASRGDVAEAERMYRESLGLNRFTGNKSNLSLTLNNLGDLLEKRGDFDGALRLYEESLTINKEIGNLHGMALNYLGLGDISNLQNDHTSAEQHWREHVRILREIGAQIDHKFIEKGY